MRRAIIGSLLALSLAIFSPPLAAEAQRAETVSRIGVLCGVRCEGPSYDALREGLRAAGWVEGWNLRVERRAPGGELDRLPALAKELIDLKMDLIVAVGPQPNRAVKDATSTIPIVMIGVADPVRAGLVQTLARPGGNLTGLATLVPGGFMAKQLELLKETVPRAVRVAALINPDNEVHRLLFPGEVPPAAAKLGVKLQVLEVRAPGEIEPAINATVRQRADALLIVGDPIFHNPARQIPDLAARAKLPAIYLPRDLAQAGGLMSYGPDFLGMFRRAATFVDKILKGAKPGDLPVEQPTKFELVINLKTAKALGLTIPQSVLIRADEVIQ